MFEIFFRTSVELSFILKKGKKLKISEATLAGIFERNHTRIWRKITTKEFDGNPDEIPGRHFCG